MKFKNMVSTMLALLLIMTIFSCNKQEVKTKPDFPELNKETAEIKNDIKIEKFFDVSDCSPMLESTVPIASDENHIFFTNPGSDEYMYSEDADKELSIYKADIGKTEMVFDELSEIIPGNAENIVRNEKNYCNSGCAKGGGPLFTGCRSEWNSLYFRSDSCKSC